MFFVNEDWFGHLPGSVNFLYDDGHWKYNIYKLINPGYTLGGTTQYGTVYGGKFFLCSKQAPRFVVCDAESMEMEASFDDFTDENGNKQGGDSRGCVAVNNEKVYVSSSNGIWIYDVPEKRFRGKITGTENSSGSLYNGQVGMMVQAGGRIFAVHQRDGLLVIDSETDQIETVIESPVINGSKAGFGTLALARDGNVWVTVGSSSSELEEDGHDLLLKVDPFTLEYEEMPIPSGKGVATGWGAWRAGTFFPSNNHNRLYWYKNSKIQVYDIDSGEMDEFFDVKAYDGNTAWSVYSAFRVHPVTEHIYMALLNGMYANPTYRAIHVCANTRELMGEYDMKRQYWFPAIPVFPDNYAPEISEQPIRQITSSDEIIIPIEDIVSDRDNLTAGIVTEITKNSNPDFLEAEIVRYNLVVRPKEEQTGTSVLSLRFNSNGKVVTTDMVFTTEDPTSIELNKLATPEISVIGNRLSITNGKDYNFSLYTQSGRLAENLYVSDDNWNAELQYPAGVYILIGTDGKEVIREKLIIK